MLTRFHALLKFFLFFFRSSASSRVSSSAHADLVSQPLIDVSLLVSRFNQVSGTDAIEVVVVTASRVAGEKTDGHRQLPFRASPH